MNIIIKIILLLIICNTISAQSHYSLRGIVTNQENCISIGDVLLLSEKDEKIIKYTVIENGDFYFESVLEGTYLLKISSLGFKEFTKKITLDKHIQINIILQEKTTELDEVQITATKKPIENIGGNLKINVANTIFSSESNPVDLLSKLPTIQISPDGNSISIIGKGNPLIYLGNQKISFEELNSLSIDAIKSIEIIKNPSVKYEAEGRSVILIARKTNHQDGFKATFSETASFKKYFNNFLNSNFSWKKDKLEFKFNASYNQKRPWESNGSHFIILDENIESDFLVEAAPSKMPQLIFGGGIYFQINTNDYFSVSTKFRTQWAAFEIDTKTHQKENTIENRILTHSNNNDHRLFSSTNINYFKSLNTWGNLFFGAQYTIYSQELKSDISDNFNNTSFIASQHRLQKFDIDAYSLKIDFEKEFKNKYKIEVGSVLSKSKTNSFADIDIISPPTKISSRFDNTEENFSVYSQLIGKSGKFDFVTGLRIENTQVKNGFNDSNILLIDREDTHLFPKASVNFEIDSTKNISLNYSKSIKRPNYTATSSTSTYINPFLEWSKNTNLKPSLTDGLSLKFQYQDNSIGFTYYHTIDPDFYNFSYNGLTKITTISSNNFKNESGITIDLVIPIKYKFWSSTNVLSFNKNTITDTNAIVEKGSPYLYFYTRHQFKINNSSSFSLSSWGYTKRNEGIFKRNTIIVVNASFTKKFFKKFNATLSFNDIFKSMIFKENYTMNRIKINTTYFTDANEVSLALKYTFGKIKNSVYKNKNIDENLDRVR